MSPRFFGFTFTADSRTCVRSRRIYTVKSLDRNLLDAWPRTKKRSKTLSISFCRCCQNKRGREKRREGKRREIGSRLGNFFYPPRKLWESFPATTATSGRSQKARSPPQIQFAPPSPPPPLEMPPLFLFVPFSVVRFCGKSSSPSRTLGLALKGEQTPFYVFLSSVRGQSGGTEERRTAKSRVTGTTTMERGNGGIHSFCSFSSCLLALTASGSVPPAGKKEETRRRVEGQSLPSRLFFQYGIRRICLIK